MSKLRISMVEEVKWSRRNNSHFVFFFLCGLSPWFRVRSVVRFRLYGFAVSRSLNCGQMLNFLVIVSELTVMEIACTAKLHAPHTQK